MNLCDFILSPRPHQHILSARPSFGLRAVGGLGTALLWSNWLEVAVRVRPDLFVCALRFDAP
jgi:hypothetical protein